MRNVVISQCDIYRRTAIFEKNDRVILDCFVLLRPDTGLKNIFVKNVLFIDIITSKDWLLLL